jgi:hypothetical protein
LIICRCTGRKGHLWTGRKFSDLGEDYF